MRCNFIPICLHLLVIKERCSWCYASEVLSGLLSSQSSLGFLIVHLITLKICYLVKAVQKSKLSTAIIALCFLCTWHLLGYCGVSWMEANGWLPFSWQKQSSVSKLLLNLVLCINFWQHFLKWDGTVCNLYLSHLKCSNWSFCCLMCPFFFFMRRGELKFSYIWFLHVR